MVKLKKFIVALMILSVTSACQQGPNGNLFSKENIGSLAGAGAGAWVGSNVGKGKGQIVGIAAGTLLGAMLGKSIGASLDRADMAYYNKTSQTALETAPTGQAQSWRNPDSGNSGVITPTRTFQQGSTYCREYSQTITVGGKTQNAFGTACRQPDGSWKINE
jgi:surface antigen